MPVFRYKGLNAQGQSVSGVRDADNERSLRAALRKESIWLTEARMGDSTVSAEDTKELSSWQRAEKWFQNFNVRSIATPQTLAILTRQLATLLKAGVQLSDSLTALTEQSENPALQQVLSDLKVQVNEGRSFSQALSRHPRVFTELYINMVAVGEASGTLDTIMFRLAEFLDNQNKLKSKVSSALFYPLIMLGLGTAVMTLLMTVVVPKITAMYDNAGKALPWNTELLIWVSKALSDYYWLVFPLFAGAVVGFFQWKKSKWGRPWWDRFVLRLPLFGNLVRLSALSRFASTAATMLKSGLPLLRTLEVVENVLGNVILTQVIAQARQSIREGESIAQPLKRSGEIPPMVYHMIAIGERSGQLENMLENIATAYTNETETKVTRLTTLLEPLMIVIMGLSVGFVVISVIMPLVNAADAIQ